MREVKRYLLTCIAACNLLVMVDAQIPLYAAEPDGDAIDFMREIRPILSQNCFMCHGPDEATRESNLRLDTRDGAVDEADSGLPAIVAGSPSESELIERVSTSDEFIRMPPSESGRQLTAEQIDLLRRWVEQGAPYAEHWSFQPPVAHAVPPVKNEAWPRNAIDHFVLARLEQQGIEPSPEADRRTLLRRLALDLTGLPPTPEEVREFVADARPDAYERQVDRLLNSPHLGERWGRHWLDLARYADSDGYLGDSLRPWAWMYRDWVIQAINRDLPFDRFTIEQIAGDLLPAATLEQRIATGFHRNSMKNTEAGADRELDQVVRTVDRTATTGTVWLGLTLGCAECHTHKFDPITHAEFYSMYAFFNSLEERDVPAAPADLQAAYEAERAAWSKEVTEVKRAIGRVLAEVRGDREDDQPIDQDVVQAILRQAVAKRTAEEQDLLAGLFEQLDEPRRELFIRYETLAASMPKPPDIKASVVGEASKKRPTHIHLRGDFRSPGQQVQPATLAVLHPLEPRAETADRLDLAHWLVDPANPLTPRTAVNHVWQHLFGRGLVNTSEDFGSTGDAPTHPELLDWLAVQFRDGGWSRKALIRTIVTSSTYRQVSRQRADLLQIDPENRWLARQGRFRVEAEIVRDLSLAVSGLLDAKISGPSVRPVMDTSATVVSRNREWQVSKGGDKYRRGMYTLLRRATPYPMLIAFDAPDTTVSCARRERGNSPVQSLTLLNDPVFVEGAQHLGWRLAERGGDRAEQWVAYAFELCLGREPDTRELDRALEFLEEQRALMADFDDSQLKALVGRSPAGIAPRELAERVVMARVLMNLDEFITRE